MIENYELFVFESPTSKLKIKYVIEKDCVRVVKVAVARLKCVALKVTFPDFGDKICVKSRQSCRARLKCVALKVTFPDFGDKICVKSRRSCRGYRTYHKT